MNARCEFHSGTPGHSIENFNFFKHKVQDLIDSRVLSFSEIGPNVITNPFPDHCGQIVSAISGEDCSDSVASSEEYQG
ncbi:unnamed protein product [Lathyrus oleraceus]